MMMVSIDAHQYDDYIYSGKTKETIFLPIIMCKKIYIDLGVNISVQRGDMQYR